jgi:hypothetical protein
MIGISGLEASSIGLLCRMDEFSRVLVVEIRGVPKAEKFDLVILNVSAHRFHGMA